MIDDWKYQVGSAARYMNKVLADRSAFSDTVLTLFWLSSMVTSLLVDTHVWGISGTTFLFGFLALLPATAFFRLAGKVQAALTSFHLRQITTVVGFFGTSAIRGMTISVLRTLGEEPRMTLFPNAAITVGFPIVISMGLAAAVEVRRKTHLEVASRLLNERDELLTLTGRFEEKLAEARRNTEREVRMQLDPVIADVRAQIQNVSTSKSTVGAIDALTRAISDVVRPMSSKLASAENSAEVERRLPLRTAGLGLRHAKLVGSRLVDIHLLFTLELAQALVFGPISGVTSASIPADVVSTAFATCLGILFIKTWPDKWKTVSFFHGILIWSLIFLVLVAIPRAIPHFLGIPGFDNPYLAAHLMDRFLLVVGFITSNALEQLEDAAEAELREVNSKLEHVVARLRRDLAVHRKHLSWLLHGPVQSALVSASIRLSSLSLAESGLRKINEEIESAVGQIEGGYSRHSDIQQALAQITGVWSHAIDFEIDIDERAYRTLDLDQGLASSVAEVLVEVVSNARRHGGATTMRIQLAYNSDDETLYCEALNNGSSISHHDKPSIGFAMFDELCWSWSLKNEDPGVLFSATF